MSDGKINQANGRLRAAKVGVTIQAIGDRLYLQATLPPKPGSSRLQPHQQRIALGIHNNPAGLKLAEKEARRVGALLDCRDFRWEPYLRDRGKAPQSIGDWVEKFRAEFAPTVTEITWETDYQQVFNQLDESGRLSVDLLVRVIESKQPNSRTRKRFVLALKRLAEYAGLEVDFRSLQGNYSAATVEPRDLPEDRAIAEAVLSITAPGWRWVVGMIAAYGLRSHECFYLDSQELERGTGFVVRVTEGKTGARLVLPYYPEWVDQFGLRVKQLPPVTGKKHADYTDRCTQFFQRNLPFLPLDLRHRWAIRTLEYGLPYEVAAKQMGHSVAVHERTYHRWITARTHQQVYDALLARGDRPLPP
jgi:integrase